jgi:hypothetical protein
MSHRVHTPFQDLGDIGRLFLLYSAEMEKGLPEIPDETFSYHMKDRQCDFVEAFALEQKYLHFHSYMPVS